MADLEALDALNLENLDEYVNDENKIVTYKWLSSSLKIPVSKSKEMLDDFVDNENSKGNQLTVTYLIGGTVALSDCQKGHKYIIVKKEFCEETKKNFEQITCCHIYSVQKSTLKSPAFLSTVDQDIKKTSLHEVSSWSGIYCPEAKRNENCVTNREKHSQTTTQTNGFVGRAPSQKDRTTPDGSKNLEKQEPTTSTSSKKRTTATSFFGGVNSKKTGKKSVIEERKHEKASTSQSNAMFGHAAKKEKAIDGMDAPKREKTEVSFFGKPLGASSKQEAAEGINKKKESEKEINECDMEVDIENVDEKKDESKNGCKDFTAKKKSKREPVAEPNEERKAKRRKTVIEDSESEDDFESFIKSSKGKKDEISTDRKQRANTSDDKKVSKRSEPREMKQEHKQKKEKKQEKKEESKSTKTESQTKVKQPDEDKSEKKDTNKPKEKRRIRRKVMKSKTYMNDEGYMVTEKVYESESATEESETEVEETAKAIDVAHKRPKEITKANNKFKLEASKHKTQASLMSFFKKK